MAKNDFKPFATAASANVTPQSEWESLPALLSGFTSGKASSAQINKALRQSTFISAALAQFVADKSNSDVIDNGDFSGFVAKLSELITAGDDVFLRKDQDGADIPDKALFRQNVGLVKQTSLDDTTSGSLIINGGHGLGANARPRAAGATGGAAGCGFFSYTAGNADNPFVGNGASGIHVQEGATYGWDLLGRDGGGIDFRLRQVSNGVAGAWSTLWTSANLVKQANQFDPIAGSVMLNGAWGWGGLGQTFSSDDAALLVSARDAAFGSRVFRNNVANTYSKRYAASLMFKAGDTWGMISVGYAASGESGGIKITGGTNAGSNTTTHELWTDKNLPNPMTASEIAGIPLPFPGAVAPSGWLKCNGQSFNTTQYPVLASRYPSGVLPDLRAEFIRGADDGRGVDIGRALLSAQAAYTPPIPASGWGKDGAFPTPSHAIPSGKILVGSGTVEYAEELESLNGAGNDMTVSGDIHPRNIAFNYIVRAA